MARQRLDCTCRGQGPLYAAPIPLYDRASEVNAAVPPAAATTVARLQLAETPICRHSNPTAIQSTAAEREVLCLLRQQNELLTEILGALNSQLSIGLRQSRTSE